MIIMDAEEEEGRVSVQAIRGKFEQLQDLPYKLDHPSSPTACHQSSPIKPSKPTTHAQDNFFPSERLRKLSESSTRRQNSNSKSYKSSCNNSSLTNSNKDQIVDIVISRSDNSSSANEDSSPEMQHKNNNKEVTSPDLHYSSDEVDIESRFHTRSKSFGNCMYFEKQLNPRKDQQTSRNNFYKKDNLLQKMKQKSTSSLLSSSENVTFENKQKMIEGVVRNMKNKDSGYVETTEKDMKSKIIKLRKLSVTTKLEKDLKNKEQKNVGELDFNSNLPKSQISPTKINQYMVKSPTSDLDKSSNPVFDKNKSLLKTCIETAANSVMKVASAVADIETPKRIYKDQFREEKESNSIKSPITDRNTPGLKISSDCNFEDSDDKIASPDSSIQSPTKKSQYEDDKDSVPMSQTNTDSSPPTRPPRRKCHNGAWVSPKKKNRAPLPPTLVEDSLNVSSECSSTGIDVNTSVVADQRQEYKDDTKQLSGQNFDSEQEVKYVTFSSENTKSEILNNNYIPTPNNNDEVDSSNVEFNRTAELTSSKSLKPENSSPLSNPTEDSTPIMTTKQTSEPNSLKQEITTPEVESKLPFSLPLGPPPKKPPRTFAYEIYKELKEKQPPKPVIPVYAQPIKKNSLQSNNKDHNKPPLPTRSKSDLSMGDCIEKPTIAPKPAHIVNKSHKRLSMVEPLLNNEKEDSTETSEFQRQAHIRFSLRRPKKPPPAPPLNNNNDNSNNNDEVNNGNKASCLRPEVSQQSSEQPHSLGSCNSPPVYISNQHHQALLKKKSMSDETLYKGRSNMDDDHIYAIPTLQVASDNNTTELHYMCSILYPEESAHKLATRNEKTKKGMSSSELDITKSKPNIIALWKQEFRQSCRQMQNRFKKNTVR